MRTDNDSSRSHSTVVRRGIDAVSFIEMANFVHELEARSLERLLTDLPGLLELTDAKFGLVAKVLRKRMRHSPESREAIEKALDHLERTAATPQVKGRCEGLLRSPA